VFDFLRGISFLVLQIILQLIKLQISGSPAWKNKLSGKRPFSSCKVANHFAADKIKKADFQ